MANADPVSRDGEVRAVRTEPASTDVGRLIITPIFALLLGANLIGAYNELSSITVVNTATVITATNHILRTAFYVLLVTLYFVRQRAKSTSQSLFANTVAIVATFTPFALGVFRRPSGDPLLLLISNITIAFGLAISVYALFVLGRSFSLIPQARTLVRRGPYRFVRHPLYVGELISMTGVVLSGPSAAGLALLLWIAAMQVYRAVKEEQLLADAFAEYDAYRHETARFIPGLY